MISEAVAAEGGHTVQSRQWLTITTQRRWRGGWQGVLQRGSDVLAGCGHRHTNRNRSGRGGRSAYECIYDRVRAAVDPDLAAAISADLRRHARPELAQYHLALTQYDSVLSQYPPGGRLPQEVRTTRRQAVRGFEAVVNAIAAHLGDEPVFGEDGTLMLPPRPVPAVPCPRCGTWLTAYGWAPHHGWFDWRPPQTGAFRRGVRCADGSVGHLAPMPVPARPFLPV